MKKYALTLVAAVAGSTVINTTVWLFSPQWGSWLHGEAQVAAIVASVIVTLVTGVAAMEAWSQP